MKHLMGSLLAVLPLTTMAAANETDLLAQAIRDESAWPRICTQLIKDEAGGASATLLRYSPKPAPASPVAWWILHWQGMAVPVPQDDYRDLLLFGQGKPGAELILRGSQASVALMLSPLDGAMAEYFPPDQAGKASPSPRAEFPGIPPFSSAEAMMEAYGGDSISCSPDRRRQEIMALAGRPMIRISGPFTRVSVHRDVGKHRGWLESGVSGDGRQKQWRALGLGSPGAPSLQIEVVVPDTPRYAGIGTLIGVDGAASNSLPPPPWLTALQAALDANSTAAWQTLQRELEKAGFSERSRERLDVLLSGGKANNGGVAAPTASQVQ